MKLLKKQAKMCEAAIDPSHKYRGVAVEGSIRSGKTQGMVAAFLSHLNKFHRRSGHSFIFAAQGVSNVQRVIMPYVRQYCKDFGLEFNEWFGAEPWCMIEGCPVYFFGGEKSDAAKRIQGYTLYGGIIDEYTTMHKDFIRQYQLRLSGEPNFTLYGANRRSLLGDEGWASRNLFQMANDLGLLQLEMLLDENTFLSPAVIAALKSGQYGHFRARNIDNEYASAEGLVYVNYDIVSEPISTYFNSHSKAYIGADYGHSTVTAAILLSKQKDGTFVAVKEFYHEGAYERRTPESLAFGIKEMGSFDNGRINNIKGCYVDPNGTALMDALMGRRLSVFAGINKPLLRTINHTGAALEQGLVKIHSSLKETINEIQAYHWPDGERQTPVKEYDHLMDSLRYATVSLVTRIC